MIPNTRKLLLALTVLVAMTASTYALPGKPGRDRPIRVGMFKGTGQGRYWHTSIHTAGASIATMLANPAAAGLGANLIIPDSGFIFTQYGLPASVTAGGTPTVAQMNPWTAALAGDSIDVALIACFVELGNVITAGAPRNALQTQWLTKGYIAAHATTDSYGTWAALDSIHAARFQNHPSAGEKTGSLRLDTVSAVNLDTSWQYLNKGIADTTFSEEWFSFTQNGNVIRSYPGVKILVNIDEATYIANSGARVMGADHPMSWFREASAINPANTGRFFYTALGHKAQNYQGGTNPRFLRRQLYNAMLWGARYDEPVGGTAIQSAKAPVSFSSNSRLTLMPSGLTVTAIPAGTHTVEIRGLDGKQVAIQTGEGVNHAYTFTGLRSGVYSISVSTTAGRSSRLVTLQ